jgi:hypothetical protein
VLWEVQKPAMSTGQMRTYPFWERKRPLCLHSALCTLHYCTLCLSLVSSPNHPTLSPLKTLSTSRQPTFWTACCYRRTFPPSISRMTVFNAIWKILSERLDDGSGFNCFRLLWGGWLIRTLQVFVLIVSSRISRNKCVMSDTKACYEHWADADISFLRKEKTAWCLPALCTIALCVSLWYHLPTTHPYWWFPLPCWCFFVVLPHHFIPTAIDDYPPCKFREAWWTCKYRQAISGASSCWTSCRNSLHHHQFTSLVLGTEDSL